MYWPNISNDIANLINNCDICQKLQKSKPKEPLKPHSIIYLPWHKVGIDIFEHEKEQYLLIVNYYSKYIELANLVKNTTSKNVIRHSKSIFARHGIPKVIVADNAPQFRSKEFKDFTDSWGIKQEYSSPYMANSNGLAERNVQTVKYMLEKCKDTNSDPYLALLQFRTTPNAFGVSPSQLLMSRLLRTRLPILNNNLRPNMVDTMEYNSKIKNHQRTMCRNYNRNAKPCPEFENSQPVLFKKDPKGRWQTGQIFQKLDLPRSYIVQDLEGQQYRRNKKHIMPDRSKSFEQDNDDLADSGTTNDRTEDESKVSIKLRNEPGLDTSEATLLGFEEENMSIKDNDRQSNDRQSLINNREEHLEARELNS